LVHTIAQKELRESRWISLLLSQFFGRFPEVDREPCAIVRTIAHGWGVGEGARGSSARACRLRLSGPTTVEFPRPLVREAASGRLFDKSPFRFSVAPARLTALYRR
jgi:hypothetical protein